MKILSKLPITEEVDFCYLLALLPVLKNMPEYAPLPELFSIIGHERLIDLCKYAGGETIQIPTLEELHDSIESLRWYCLVFVDRKKTFCDIPEEYVEQVNKIHEQMKIES